MRLRSRIAWTALTTALVLGAVAGAASAGRLELSELGYLIKWPSTARVTFENTAETAQAVCAIRFKGSFHARTLTKTLNNLIGSVIESEKAPSCSSGEVWILDGVETPPGERTPPAASFPWHITYQSFAGRLPSITSIRLAIIGFSIQIQEFFESCLYKSTTTRPFLLDIGLSAELITRTVTPVAGATIPVFRGSGFCPELTARGTGTEVTIGGKGRGIVFRLI